MSVTRAKLTRPLICHVLRSYWTASAIYLQFIKRCALVASNAGIAEAYCFPTQFAFDMFASLIFLKARVSRVSYCPPIR